MIPKIIHYCWFGPKQIPENHQRYIRRWKELMPDYEYICWNENKIDVTLSPFLKQAYDAKMWAFVADYTRIYALIKYGGIYMDTDVEVCERFDSFLKYSFFTSVEYHPNYADAPTLAKMVDSLGKRLPEIPPKKKIPGVGYVSPETDDPVVVATVEQIESVGVIAGAMIGAALGNKNTYLVKRGTTCNVLPGSVIFSATAFMNGNVIDLAVPFENKTRILR